MKRIPGLCFCLLTLPAFAQDAAVDDLDDIGPAVDTSVEAIESAADNELDDFEPAVAELDDYEPGVASPVLAAEGGSRGTPGVMDELDLGATEVTGNQELPKVLYIVPWRDSDPGDLMGRPGNTLLDDVLAPVDRNEFTREVDYYSDLFGEDQQQ